MAEIKSFPNNQDVYVGAEWVMKWLHGRTSGVFGAEGNLSMTVMQDSMSIQISDGIGWLSNANGDGIVFWNDSEQTNGSKLTLTHDVADGVLDRIDRIVVTWETTNYVALPTISILKGTASSTPVPPALTNNTTQRQISLARVNIPAGTVSLSSAMITDERLDPEVCGLVTESVAADTSVINAQFAELLEQLETAIAQVWDGEIGDGSIGVEKLSNNFVLPIGRGGTGETTLDGLKNALGLENVGVRITKIWENASPTSEFAAQTISLDLSAYSFILFHFKTVNTSETIYSSGFFEVGTTGMLQCMTSSNTVRQRNVEITTTGVSFGAGAVGGSTASNNNSVIVPTAIFGVKGGV